MNKAELCEEAQLPEKIKQSCLRGRISERVIAESLEEAKLPEMAERLNAESFEI